MKKLNNLKSYLLAFIIPFIILILVFFAKGIWTDIENIYVSDLRLQHMSFLNYFRNVLIGEVDPTYSFYAGMGNSMISTIIFYCLSPVNLLLLFFKNITHSIIFIYIVKLSLAGLTMFILLKNKFNRNKFIMLVFSTCYALCAFVINYFFSIFWFDSLYLAPLVILGIEKIFNTKKISLLYIFSLALAIICNIQMGFGLCIFSLIYFIYNCFINYNIKLDIKKLKSLVLIFIFSSLCAGIISSGAICGFILDYGNISSARDISVSTVTGTSNLGYILKNFFTVGNYKFDYYNNYEPFIYSGLLISFFAILYFFNDKIDKNKKIGAFFVILIFIISFCTKFINLFWHLSTPVLLNYRYSVYLALFLTLIACESYLNKEKLVTKDITILIISLFIGFFIIMAYSNEVYVIWTFVFLILISTLIYLTKNKNKRFELLLILTVFLEIFMNGYLSIYTASELPFGKYSSYNGLKELSTKNTFDDNYRVMYNYSYTDMSNDTFLLNKNSSLRYFSSVINGNVLKFFERNLSTFGNNNYRISSYDSPLLLSLLGAKYFYLNEEISNSIYEKIDTYEIKDYNYETKKYEKHKVYLYENPYALSLGYVIDKDVKYNKKMDLVDYQNEIIKSFTGKNKDVLIRLDYDVLSTSDICNNSVYNSCKSYEIKNNTNNILVYVFGRFEQYTIDNNAKQYFDVNSPLLISTIDNKINLTLEYMGDLNKEKFAVTTYDETNLINNLKTLQKSMLKDIKINKNTMKAKIDSNRDGILFLSLPYDKKFKIYVDDKETKYYPLLDKSFIGLDIKKGNHNIKIEYIDNNYKIYILITIISILITTILTYFINKNINKKQQEELIKLQELEEKKKNKKKTKNKKRK